MPDSITAPELDLSGAGRNFLWSTLPTVVTLVSSIFVLSFSVRRLGVTEYGAVVTIGAATSLLTLFSGALRYAVIRSGAHFDDPAEGDTGAVDEADAASIRTAHALFVAAAVGLVLIAAGLGWLIPLDLGLRGPAATQTYVATIIFVSAAACSIGSSAFAGLLTSSEQFGRAAQISLASFAIQVSLTVALAGRYRIIGIAVASLIAAMIQACALGFFARRRAPWLGILPRRSSRGALASVLHYAGGLVVLSATSTISSASDAFIIAAVAGGGAVTIFRIGSTAPVALVALLYGSFGVLFPRLVRGSDADQEEGVAAMGRTVGWVTGSIYAGLCLVGADLVRLLLGHGDRAAMFVLWISAGALAVDVSYHGVVQVVFARGEQGRMAKFSWVELGVNLLTTVTFVEILGPVGSAWALATTIVVTDFVGFPLIMRGHWGSPPGRFVLRNGLVQSLTAGALAIGLGVLPVLLTSGLVVHLVLVGAIELIVLLAGVGFAGEAGRRRLRTFVRPRPARLPVRAKTQPAT